MYLHLLKMIVSTLATLYGHTNQIRQHYIYLYLLFVPVSYIMNSYASVTGERNIRQQRSLYL